MENTKIRTSAGSAARQCAHVKGEKLARWPYVGIVLKVSLVFTTVSVLKHFCRRVSERLCLIVSLRDSARVTVAVSFFV